MKFIKSVHRAFLYGMIALAVISIVISATLIISFQYQEFYLASKELKSRYITTQKQIIKNEVEKVIDYIYYMKSLTEKRLKEQIKARTIEAYNIAMNIYEENKDTKDIKQIMKEVTDALRPIRFNKGRGYYFATNLEGIEQLFADKPEMEGKNLLDMQDMEGKYVIRDMIALARKENEGFYRYTWTKPNITGKNFPKIAYIKYFEPFGWFIGTGEYLDDVEADIKKEILERIEKIRFGKDGYIFVVTYDGVTLMNPVQRDLIGKNLWELTDPNGVKVIQEERKAVQNPDGAFIHYVWGKPSQSEPVSKISFMKGVPEWKWMAGAGVYIDEIDKIIEKKRIALGNEVKQRILQISLVLIFLLLLVYGLARFVSNRMKINFDIFSLFFQKAATESIQIDRNDLHFTEFENLALSANQMIDQRKQAEKSLRESEERLALAIEGSGIGLWDWQVQTGAMKVNERWAEICGYLLPELDPIDANTRTRLSHPDDMKRSNLILEKHFAGETTFYECELRLKHRTGRWVWVLERGKVADWDKNANPVRMAGTLLDITERKLAEDTIRQSEERHRTILQTAMDGFCLMDLQGRLLEVNEAYCRMSGHSEEELLSMNISDLAADESESATEEIRKAVCHGEHRFETKQRRKDGRVLDVEVSVKYRGMEGGRFTCFVRDITERKQIEFHLQHAQRMEAIGTLAGGIAHDFNNILFPLVGFAEMLREELPAGSTVRKYVDEILRAALRARDLVKQILTFSRRGDQDIKFIRLQPIAEEAIKLLRSSIPTTIGIQQEIDPDCGVVAANPTQIHRVIMNLVTNAYHSMEDTGGRITVSIKEVQLESTQPVFTDLKPGKYALLSIYDMGTGIDPSIMSKVFDPYFTTKDKSKGTGLGLSVVQGVVKSCNGAIRIYSEQGKGTEVHVYLPIVHQQSEDEAANVDEIIQGDSEKILLVDDEEAIVMMEKQMLERLGYTVEAQTGSVAALESFKADPCAFDLILTDMTMPFMTGVQLAKAVKDIRPGIPVIICTGFSDRLNEEKSKELGIEGYATKPVRMRELAELVRKALKSYEIERKL